MKPFDLPITHNLLKTRDDLAESLLQLLEPVPSHLALCGGGLFVGNSSATYSSRVALFEGWSRLLWAIGPFYAGGYEWKGLPEFYQGFINGPDPESEGYWGDVADSDQRMVEMAALSLALMFRRDVFWDPMTDRQKKNMSTWLLQINSKAMPDNNWRFFRILMNLSMKELGEEYGKARMEEDWELMESYYEQDGWYRDLIPFDNYNPFGFHFYSLVYYKYMKDEDPERCVRIKERTELFARQYIHFFTAEGNSVPFGRSLAYRFAVSSFFSACAFAGLEVLPWGVMKGILLRNLRWWFSKPIFDSTGMLTIGYAYPSLIVADEYNAPGSPYWGCKAYLVLALGEDHPFWQAEELPLPELDAVKYLRCPRMLSTRHSDGDVVFLAAGQTPSFKMNQVAEKYCKFAYSANYGFSAAISSWEFEFTGCDSMLYVSEGDNYWKPRRGITEHAGDDTMVRSTWSPADGLVITTWLIPAGDFHVRIHKLVSDRPFQTKEGGFAILHYREHEMEPTEVRVVSESVSAIGLPWGSSVMADLSGSRRPFLAQPRPNLNLLASTTVVPCLEGEIGEGTSWLGCIAGAGKAEAMWENLPEVRFDKEAGTVTVNGIERKFI